MTHRLYYDDAYLTQFTATVLDCRPERDGWAARLNRSAFYPTSGGQPYDTGVLGGARVLDVWVDQAGEVWHLTDAPLEVGAQVEGRIDWPRRFDHMQQHAGEHMLAGVIWRRLGGRTIGLHLGDSFSTIDVELPGGQMRVEPQVLAELEETVNAQIQADLPIRCYFPTPQQLAQAPLRKPPTVREHIRLVQVGDVECVACGGTHPASSGQIGLVKILDARPSRGKMRVSFVCGMRALRDYQQKFLSAQAAAALLSTGVEELPKAVEHALERLHQAQRELKRAQLDRALDRAAQLTQEAAALPGGGRAVSCVLAGLDRDGLREVAGYLTGQGVAALLAGEEGPGAPLVFAAPAQLGLSMGQLLSQVLKPLGGKGGGRPDFAQGAGPGRAALEAAMARLSGGAETAGEVAP